MTDRGAIEAQIPRLERASYKITSPKDPRYNCFAWASRGFEECGDGDLEEGYEKIAVFADSSGEPRHAARQLSTGAWTSKLGDHVDIEHSEVNAVGGVLFGEPAAFLRRPRPAEFTAGGTTGLVLPADR